MSQQRVHDNLVALNNIENTIGQPCILQKIRHEKRRRRVAITRLENERVAGRNRDREHPAWDHSREVERCDPRDHTQRLPDRPVIHACRDLLGIVPLEQLRDATGELDDVDAARDFPLSIGEYLAVLSRDDCGEFVTVLVHQFEETQHDARAANRRRVAPLRKRRLCAADASHTARGFAQQQLARTRASSWIKDGLVAGSATVHALAMDEMSNVRDIAEGLHIDSSGLIDDERSLGGDSRTAKASSLNSLFYILNNDCT